MDLKYIAPLTKCSSLLFFLFILSVQSLTCVRLFVTPGTAAHWTSLSFTISWSLLRLMSIESVMPSNHLIHCHPFLLLPSIFSSIRVFSKNFVQFFASGGQSTGASASALVLLMNMQGWVPLGWTALNSLLLKGLSRVLTSTTIQKHWFSHAQTSLRSNSHIHTWLLEKKYSLDCTDLGRQSDVSAF